MKDIVKLKWLCDLNDNDGATGVDVDDCEDNSEERRENGMSITRYLHRFTKSLIL